jgi:hypothetical protein
MGQKAEEQSCGRSAQLRSAVSWVPLCSIGNKLLGVTTSQAQKYVAAIRSRHPAAKMTDEEKFVESCEVLREVGLLFRQVNSRARAEGEPVQALLASLSTHSDRYARFLTKQSAVPTVEVNASFNSDLWNGLMGAVPAVSLESAAVVVEKLPDGQGSGQIEVANP